MSTPSDVLRNTFGLDSFRPGQEEVIGHLLAGRSAAAFFPTGGGKSLCYQLPALLLPGLTVVVSPLIALMKEQIDRLQALGIAAERLDSTRTADQARQADNALRNGRLRLLYVAPERFHNERFREILQRTPVSLFAVDEAHCISEWGHNFRPDYLKLASFARLFRAERTLALTATATPQVLADICRGFGIDPACAVRTGFYRPNLTYLMTATTPGARDQLRLDRLATRPRGPTIVSVTFQRTAEQVASRLAAAGVPARAYHAGMETPDRVTVQEWFAGSDQAVVVATIAFGMGIDKADIRAVYHYNLPKSLENLSQEIGRAGRDGLPATCETFVCLDDLDGLENFIYGDTPSPGSVRGLVDDLFSLGDHFAVSLTELGNTYDLRQSVVKTLLAYLELDGYLEGGTAIYSSYQFRPLKTSAEILAGFQGERRTFLANVFRQAVKARIWFTLDVERAARATASPRDRVVRALDYLAGQNLLELKLSDVLNRYRRLRMPTDPDELAATLHRRTLEREEREIRRLRQVVELATHDGCQVSRLGEHFGEPLDKPCGHCSWCLGTKKPMKLPPRPQVVLDPNVLHQARALRRHHPEALGEPRQLARFLCRLSSPRLVANKLTRHPLYGSLDVAPFPQVLAWAEGETRT
jgi:ATP-dependent DNA helicase RecQ